MLMSSQAYFHVCLSHHIEPREAEKNVPISASPSVAPYELCIRAGKQCTLIQVMACTSCCNRKKQCSHTGCKKPRSALCPPLSQQTVWHQLQGVRHQAPSHSQLKIIPIHPLSTSKLPSKWRHQKFHSPAFSCLIMVLLAIPTGMCLLPSSILFD